MRSNFVGTNSYRYTYGDEKVLDTRAGKEKVLDAAQSGVNLVILIIINIIML